MNGKEQEIAVLLNPAVEDSGCSIWGLEWLVSGRRRKLLLYIDRPGGISIEDCENVSRLIGDVLDVESKLNERYELEVSSPGLDRILFTEEQYKLSIGYKVEAKLNYPIDGRKRVTGVLIGLEDGDAVLREEDIEYLLPLANIQRARIVPEFENIRR